MVPEIDFFPWEDAILVKLTDSRVVADRSIDENRIHQDRNIVGISFMDVSHGVKLAALPQELLIAATGPEHPRT